MYIGLRPMTSDVEDQTKRPLMLQSESRPTKPAAAAASTVSKWSWIIGAACSRIPMPAVTLQNSTTHSSQNCGVRIALAAVTLPRVTSSAAARASGVQPVRAPALGRHAHRERAEHHHHEVDRAEREEGRCDRVRGLVGERARAARRTAARRSARRRRSP